MRVIYLNPFSQEVSGPDESLRTLLSRLIPLGVEAHVVIPTAGPQQARYEALGARTHVSPMTILRRGASPAEVFHLGTSGVVFLRRMIRLCRAIRPDVVHTNMEVVVDGLLTARYLGIPHVLHYRGNTLDEPRWVFDVLTRLWTATSQQIFCISKATARLFESRGLAGKVEVMYNPIDLESFTAARRDTRVRLELGAAPEAWLVGTVARLHPRKDLETFLRSAAQLAEKVPNAKFVIVGAAAGAEEIAYAERLRALSRELGIADLVTWAGARRDIPTVMKTLDAFVLTSRHEGFGRVVAEAMAAGCPVIVTSEGALPELLDHGRYGLCAEPGQPSSFARRLVELSNDPALRTRLARAALERSRTFDANVVASRMLDAYRRLRAHG